MRGQLQTQLAVVFFRGWEHSGSTRLKKGLYSNRYRNQEGWTAQEVFGGAKDNFIGLQVHDSEGQFVGMAQKVEDLP